jgi:DNA recombination protein RmuC
VNVKFTDLLKENRENENYLRDAITKTLDSLNNSINDKMEKVTKTIESMTEKVDSKLQTIQKDNNEQLEKMRLVVDEKLQKTLNERL